MRTLVLIRHAAAEPPRGDDHARHLTAVGREDCARVRRWLSDQGLVPDRVVVSTAVRAQETWELAGVGRAAPEPDERLYDASVADLAEVVAETEPDVACLVVVGHNPGLERLAYELDDSNEARDRTNRGMDPGAVAVFRLTAWTDSVAELVALES